MEAGKCVVDSVQDNSAAAAWNAEQVFIGRAEHCIRAGDVLVKVADVVEAADPDDQDDIEFAGSLLHKPAAPETLLQTLMRTATEVALDFHRDVTMALCSKSTFCTTRRSSDRSHVGKTRVCNSLCACGAPS